jgi:periplasmic divalent cation tolerance protein
VAIKTRQVLYSKVEAAIRNIHPYELPEIVAVPITDAFAAYLDWIDAETRS